MSNRTSRDAYYYIYDIAAGIVGGPGAKPELRHMVVKHWGRINGAGQVRAYVYDNARRSGELFDTVIAEKARGDYRCIIKHNPIPFNCPMNLRAFRAELAERIHRITAKDGLVANGSDEATKIAYAISDELRRLDFSMFSRGDIGGALSETDRKDLLEVRDGDPDYLTDASLPASVALMPEEVLPPPPPPPKPEHWGAW